MVPSLYESRIWELSGCGEIPKKDSPEPPKGGPSFSLTRIDTDGDIHRYTHREKHTDTYTHTKIHTGTWTHTDGDTRN